MKILVGRISPFPLTVEDELGVMDVILEKDTKWLRSEGTPTIYLMNDD
jgi:hypothetical protein